MNARSFSGSLRGRPEERCLNKAVSEYQCGREDTPAFNAAAQRSVDSAIFGEIIAAQGQRNIQFALKFYF
jgi:hypothetical protein